MAHQARRAKKHSKLSAQQQPSRDRVREYSERAVLENQPRLTDLIPKSLWAYLAMLLLGGISIYACQQAFIHTRALDTSEFPKHLFDVSGTGNIASWCMSVMLLLLSVGAVLVYLLRRHKADDYRGRYRLWLYLAGFAGFLSFDVATGVHQILSVPLAGITMPAPWDQASIWWVVVISSSVFYLAARLLIEFKSRPGMLMILAVAVLVLIAAGCSRLGGVIGDSVLTTDVAQSTLIMSATLVVCFMTWLNARKVYLDAQQGSVGVGRPRELHRDRNSHAKTASEVTEQLEETLAEQDPQWDDWDELGDEEGHENGEVEQEYVEYVEEEIDDLDELDDAEQEQADEELYEDVESEYAVEEEDIEEESEEELEYESEVDQDEQEAQPQQDEEVVYSAYATESTEPEVSSNSTAYETPDDESQQSTLLIPPQHQTVEHEPFDEDAFWDQYDLTKMSRKQLKTMRKKLNRLKRKHAERQRAA